MATDGRMIPPPAQRAMAERAGTTIAETSASHSIYVSQPQATADLIRRAAMRERLLILASRTAYGPQQT